VEIWPAIDIRAGKCVRLKQADYARETVFGDDPAAMARHWVELGAKCLHLVDLDGAREGRPANLESIRGIVATSGVPCELGGGIRDEETIRSLLAIGRGPPLVAVLIELGGEIGLEHAGEMREIECGRLALVPANRVDIAGFRGCFGLLGQVFGDARRQAAVMVAHEQGALVDDFSGDERLRQLEAYFGLVEAADLGAARLGAGRVERVEHGHESAGGGEKRDRDAASGQGLQGLAGDLNAAEERKAFDAGQRHFLQLLAVGIDDGHGRAADADFRAVLLGDDI